MYDYSYYDYGYDYGYQAASGLAAGFLVFGIIMWVIGVAISIITIIAMWKVFKKAGKPGWAAIIPVYNIIVMLEIAELPMWYIALYFVPGANIYAMIKTYIEVAHKFGKSTGFGVGIAFLSPIFLSILAFNKNVQFVGAQNNVQPEYQQPVQPAPQVQPVTPVQPVQQFVEPHPMPEVTPVVPVEPIAPAMAMPEVNPVAPVEPIAPAMPEVNPVQPVQQPEISQPMTPAFCTNCGNSLMPNAKFCTKCGKQI